jgi:hypothetical protein
MDYFNKKFIKVSNSESSDVCNKNGIVLFENDCIYKYNDIYYIGRFRERDGKSVYIVSVNDSKTDDIDIDDIINSCYFRIDRLSKENIAILEKAGFYINENIYHIYTKDLILTNESNILLWYSKSSFKVQKLSYYIKTNMLNHLNKEIQKVSYKKHLEIYSSGNIQYSPIKKVLYKYDDNYFLLQHTRLPVAIIKFVEGDYNVLEKNIVNKEYNKLDDNQKLELSKKWHKKVVTGYNEDEIYYWDFSSFYEIYYTSDNSNGLSDIITISKIKDRIEIFFFSQEDNLKYLN